MVLESPYLNLKVLSQYYAKHGRIHGYPSRVRVGRGSAGEGH